MYSSTKEETISRVFKNFESILTPIMIGLASFLLIVGPSRLNPKNIGWISNTRNPDTWQQYLGWEIYRKNDWNFPIGKNVGIIGQDTSIIYSGGIPLLEIPLKLVSPVFGSTFQYLGIWLLVCFIMQSIASWLLLSEIKKLQTKEIAIGVVLFTFSPILIWRVNLHLGLVAHFLILLAFYLAIKQPAKYDLLRWSSLLTTCLLVHGYFFVMVLVSLFFHFLDSSRRATYAHISNINFKLRFLVMLFPPIVTAFCLNYFSSTSGWNTGFPNHLFKMDLTQPLNFTGQSWIFSSIFPETVGNPEGFNFLGLWTVLAAFYLIRKSPNKLSDLRGFLRENRFVLLAGLIMALFALSNQVSIGRRYLEIPIPDVALEVMEIFRASGRFFWPMVYLIYFILFKLISEVSNIRNRLLFLVLAALFHVSDTSYFWLSINDINKESLTKQVLLLEGLNWEEQKKHYEEIVYLPKLETFPRIDPCQAWMSVGYVAARFNFSTNCTYLARYNVGALKEFTAILKMEISQDQLRANRIYLLEYEFLDGLDLECVRLEKFSSFVLVFPKKSCYYNT